jgi:hypothetical protein
MLTINNKLTRAFASGSLAIGVATLASLAGSTLLAPSAQAADFNGTVGEVRVPGFSWRIDDKVFSNFVLSIASLPQLDDEDTVDIFQVGGVYQLQTGFSPGANNALTLGGTLQYDVTIDPLPNGYVFDEVAFDTDQLAQSSATKTVTNLVDSAVTTLTSTNGSNVLLTPILGAPTKAIRVLDTYQPTPVGDPGYINGSSNKFTQRQIPPTPESSPILGLIALGGLGLVAKMRKQK